MNLLARFDFLVVTLFALLLKRIFKNLFIAIIRPGQHIQDLSLCRCISVLFILDNVLLIY